MFKEFNRAYPEFVHEAGGAEEGPPIPGEEADAELPIEEFGIILEEYYTGDFAEEYELLNPDQAPNMTRMLEMLNDNSKALQYYYIADNPNPLGTKEEFVAANDNSNYTQTHRKYHESILDFMSRFVFEDIFFMAGYKIYFLRCTIRASGSIALSMIQRIVSGEIPSDESCGSRRCGQH